MPWTPDTGNVLYAPDSEYELLEYIDTGGFTTVYRSRRRSNGEVVGIKYPNYNSVNERVDENVEREVNALRTVGVVGGHPNIMTLQNHFTMRGTDFLVVEFIDGTEVAESDQFATTETIRNVSLKICDAVSLLHSNGLIYRDLTGQNLLLTPSLEPMLIDFNMVNTATRCDECDKLATPTDGRLDNCSRCNSSFSPSPRFNPTESGPYRAAEQFEPDFPIGPWSDVYAIGKLIYYFVEGYAGRGDGINPADESDNCPEYLGEIVERATAFDPADRYETAAALGQALWDRDPNPDIPAGTLENIRTGTQQRVTDGTTVGRPQNESENHANRLALSDTPMTVSRQHCTIQRDEWRWKIEDTSRNGTYTRRNDRYHVLTTAGGDSSQIDAQDRGCPPDTRSLQHGDVISLVDPLIGPSLRFHANEWDVR